MSRNKYTEIHKEWVRNNAPISYTKELILLFKDLFNIDTTYKQISSLCQDLGITTLGSIYSTRDIELQCYWLYENANKYDLNTLTNMYNLKFESNVNSKDLLRRITNNNYTYLKLYKNIYDQIQWLKQTAPNCESTYTLCKQYNAYFNTHMSRTGLIYICIKYGIKYTDKIMHKYTQKEIDWMSDNYTNYLNETTMDWDKMLQDFNEKFNCNISNCSTFISTFYYRQKNRLNNRDLIRLKASKKANKINTKSIGDTMIYKNQCYIKIKDGPYYGQGKSHLSRQLYFRKKSHILYEEYYNVKIDDNKYTVIHLDNDFNNFSKDNLYLISRPAYYIYTGMKFKNESKETKINALTICEILALTKEK